MSLSAEKAARIKAMGARVTTVEEWLDLSAEEVAIIDMKIRLGEELKAQRKTKRLSQEKVAKLLKTSQGRGLPRTARRVCARAGRIEEEAGASDRALTSRPICLRLSPREETPGDREIESGEDTW